MALLHQMVPLLVKSSSFETVKRTDLFLHGVRNSQRQVHIFFLTYANEHVDLKNE